MDRGIPLNWCQIRLIRVNGRKEANCRALMEDGGGGGRGGTGRNSSTKTAAKRTLDFVCVVALPLSVVPMSPLSSLSCLWLLLGFFFLLALPSLALGLRQQSVGAKGRLFCGTQPAQNVLVKLYDKDTGLDPDDQLDSARTDASGNFKVQGDERETTNIDPELRIYHHCNKGLNPCPRKWIITVPDKYIHSGKAPPKKYFELGNINLEVEVEGESFDCIH
ncbi:hypothetical protein niasHT_008152 [Heterodera trifolii]|uniref:Transthyretin-like protein 46 n=1 Tax=Heterodera trifolii TaxID=157864 RepID=A0ABD2M024_9BILA